MATLLPSLARTLKKGTARDLVVEEGGWTEGRESEREGEGGRGEDVVVERMRVRFRRMSDSNNGRVGFVNNLYT